MNKIPKKKKEQFQKALIELCKEHGLVAVPTYGAEPSAHDPVKIVEFDAFWLGFFTNRVL